MNRVGKNVDAFVYAAIHTRIAVRVAEQVDIAIHEHVMMWVYLPSISSAGGRVYEQVDK